VSLLLLMQARLQTTMLPVSGLHVQSPISPAALNRAPIPGHGARAHVTSSQFDAGAAENNHLEYGSIAFPGSWAMLHNCPAADWGVCRRMLSGKFKFTCPHSAYRHF
jgi:hypothetical protein